MIYFEISFMYNKNPFKKKIYFCHLMYFCDYLTLPYINMYIHSAKVFEKIILFEKGEWREKALHVYVAIKIFVKLNIFQNTPLGTRYGQRKYIRPRVVLYRISNFYQLMKDQINPSRYNKI